ncbi:MAG: DOMON-like domain-containing protein [Cyanobacteria bacterium P01_D01_bin.123]
MPAKLKRNLVLQPFPEAISTPNVTLRGSASRQSRSLALTYVLQGNLTELTLPGVSSGRDRRDLLWQTTCFEWFLRQPEHSTYWEFNVSPSGDWNAYRFSDYRQHITEETAIEALPFRVTRTEECFQLEVEVNLGGILVAKTPIEVAIAAVIQTQSGELSYWALHHPKERADFHAREGFRLAL